MTLLSLFMTSTGIFCFVPISQRLIESGIVPASNHWRLRRLPAVLAPTFYYRKAGIQSLPAVDKLGDALSEVEVCRQVQSPLPHIPLHSVKDTFTADQQQTMPCVDAGSGTVSSESLACYPANSLLHSTSFDTFYGRESASFVSNSTLCDSCNDLLRRELEIPPDHIPSVVRVLALFETRDRSSDVAFNECEIVALTDAFSMLRLY